MVVTFDEEGVELVVRDAEGEDLIGETSTEGTTSTWTVSGSHGTNATYEVWGVKDGCEEQVSTFTTGPWRFADLDGQVFRLDLDEADGPGSRTVNQALGGDMDLGLWNREGTNDFWTGVPIDGDDQDLCSPTTDLQGGFVNSELFLRLDNVPWVEDSDGAIRWVGTEITALVPSDDPSVWERVRIQGEIDFSPLASVGGDCGAFEALGETCGPCSDGGGPICIAVDITGGRASAAALSPVQTQGEDCSE